MASESSFPRPNFNQKMDETPLLTKNHNLVLGIIGGTGLDNPDILSDRKEHYVSTPFGKPSDVLISGKISNVDCVLQARHGRKHSLMPSNVNYRANIYALKKIGATHIIATTACGSLKEEFAPKQFALLTSFIDRTYKRKQTFYDSNDKIPYGSFNGICHIPMGNPYCTFQRDTLYKKCEKLGIGCHKNANMVSVEGPRFGSKAESHMMRGFGGDLVNMTQCPEAILAAEAGLCYAAVAMVTDYDCWKEDESEHCDVAKIMEIMKENTANMLKLVVEVTTDLDKMNWIEESKEIRHQMATSNFIGRDASLPKEYFQNNQNQQQTEELVNDGNEDGKIFDDQIGSPKKNKKDENNDIIIKGLPFDATPEDIKNHFNECGEITRVSILRDNYGNSKGCAFITFTNNSSVILAEELNGTELGDRKLFVERTKPKETNKNFGYNNNNNNNNRNKNYGYNNNNQQYNNGPPLHKNEEYTIFVGNLGFNTDVNQLWDLFSNCGKIIDVRLAKKPDGSNKGFAHVEFENNKSALAAIEYSGSKIDGRVINVDYSAKAGNKGGNYRGGGGDNRQRRNWTSKETY